MTRYSVQSRDIFVKGYGFVSFTKNMVKNVSGKYDQISLDYAKKSERDCI